MSEKMTMGIAATGGRNWLGGVSFVELLIKAVATLPRNERPDIAFILTENLLADFELFRTAAGKADMLIYFGHRTTEAERILEERTIWCETAGELFSHIDIYFPVNSGVSVSRPAISWIPDFQHQYLPEFFSSSELAERDQCFKDIADHARMVIFSSLAVEQDFWRTFPQSRACTAVINYRIEVEPYVYQLDPELAQKKYNLPDRFVLCCNQFWVHKNHRVLFEAIARLRRQGKNVHVVCTGKTYDYRWPQYFEKLFAYVNELGIEDLVHILGVIPRDDQLQLLRRCLCVVQPSLFEGLSLIVCEARALGKPILVSDIPVHREQQYGIYFSPHSAEELSAKIDEGLASWRPGPDREQETTARIAAKDAVTGFAKEFCRAVKLAAKTFGVSTKQQVNNQDGVRNIIVVTSLAPGNIEVQRRAVDSWQALGLSVVSLNATDEIGALQSWFTDVKFIQVDQDAREQFGKPFVLFNDVLKFLNSAEAEICGIINSDIILDHPKLRDFIEKEAPEHFLFGCRIDIADLDVREGTVNIGGYDYFFFNKKVIACYPPEQFYIGLPWWDYWAVLWPMAKGIKTKKIMTPVAFHLQHDTAWGGNSWFPLGQIFSSHIKVPFPINDQTMIEFQRFVQHMLEKHSEHVGLE